MRHRTFLAVACAGVLAFGAAACGDDDDSSTTAGTSGGSASSESLSGTIRIDGSSTVAPLSEAAAELFQNENSGVKVTVGTSGTGGGFEKFCAGETDISDASREISEEEIAACESAGIAFEEIPVANDAISVVVNPQNPVECLTIDQLSQMWDKGSTVANWSQVDGVDVGDHPLELYGPGTDSGTFDYFTDEVNGEEGVSRSDYNNIGEDDNGVINGVAGDQWALGYVGYSYVAEAGDQVKPVPIENPDTGECVEPTLQTVQDGSYAPLGRSLFVYPSDASLQKPEVLGFLTFYLENGEPIAEAATMIPLTAEQAQESIDKVHALAGGTAAE